MTDTNPTIEMKLASMMMAKTGVERLKMGFSMFDMAKKIVIASILASGNKSNLRSQLLLRFYKVDLDSKTIDKILKTMDARKR